MKEYQIKYLKANQVLWSMLQIYCSIYDVILSWVYDVISYHINLHIIQIFKL